MRKKIFSLWNKWLMIGFGVCCGVLSVLAVTTSLVFDDIHSFTYLRTTGDYLTVEQWNLLMGKLDQSFGGLDSAITDVSNDVLPAGEVVAFTGPTCPTGWTFYEVLSGKFILGGSVGSLVPRGQETITLGVQNLPEHQHHLFSTTGTSGTTGDWIEDSDDGYGGSIQRTYTVNDSDARNYKFARAPYSAGSITIGKSGNPVGAQNDPIDIIPPYITLIYCKKDGDSYATPRTDDPDPVPDGDETYYTITYLSGSTTLKELSVLKGSKTSCGYTPSLEGYDFEGWYDNAGLTTEHNCDTAVNSDIMLYAKWKARTPGSVYYNITYLSGSTTLKVLSVPKGSKTSCGYTPSLEGYDFEGWYDNVSLTTEHNCDMEVNSNLTLYAKWKARDPGSVYYNITYLSGSTTLKVLSVPKGSTASCDFVPSLEGYDFKGWYDNTSLTTKHNCDTAVNSNLTLYAKWKARDPGTVYYNVTFDPRNDSPYINVPVASGDTVSRPADPVKEGRYEFAGWYKGSSLPLLYDFANPVVNDIVLRARYWGPYVDCGGDKPTNNVESCGRSEYSSGGDFLMPALYSNWTVFDYSNNQQYFPACTCMCKKNFHAVTAVQFTFENGEQVEQPVALCVKNIQGGDTSTPSVIHRWACYRLAGGGYDVICDCDETHSNDGDCPISEHFPSSECYNSDPKHFECPNDERTQARDCDTYVSEYGRGNSVSCVDPIRTYYDEMGRKVCVCMN